MILLNPETSSDNSAQSFPKSPRPFRKFRAPRRAFTLVEVCLALGIMSFSAIALLGLLPTALDHLGGSIDKSRAQTISRQVLVEARQMGFLELSNQDDYERFFTNEGDAVEVKNSTVAYTARISVNKNGATRLPGDNSDQSTLLTVTVEIHRTPGGNDIKKGSKIQSFVSLMACPDLGLIAGNSASTH